MIDVILKEQFADDIFLQLIATHNNSWYFWIIYLGEMIITSINLIQAKFFVLLIKKIQENYNTPLEHTPGNPLGQLRKESHYSLLVKV